jgi:hypothetical protein
MSSKEFEAQLDAMARYIRDRYGNSLASQPMLWYTSPVITRIPLYGSQPGTGPVAELIFERDYDWGYRDLPAEPSIELWIRPLSHEELTGGAP